MDLRLSRLLRAGIGALLALGVLAAPAFGQSEAGSTGGTPESAPEEQLRLSSAQAIEIASEDANVREAEAERGRLSPVAQAKPPDTWQVGFKDGDDEVVQILVDDATGTVRESWTGYQVESRIARGYVPSRLTSAKSFGGVINAPWVWIPLCAIFLIGLLDFRRLRRTAHLDLLVLLGFGLSHYFYNRGEIGLSESLVDPVLLYLLARMLWIGFRGAGEGLRPTMPAFWLGAMAIFLLAFRLVVNIADSGVIDVGYAGVIGADHLARGDAIWGGDILDGNEAGGYGFANYLVYLPFELGLPWSGAWDDLPAAHAAAIAFDLAAAGALFMVGMHLRPGQRGRELGAILLFAWAAYPYTAYALASNVNDSLVAALIAWSLVVFFKPVGRGVLLATAAAVKFAPLALAPLYTAGDRGLLDRDPGAAGIGGWLRTHRGSVICACAIILTSALFLIYPAIEPGLATFYERTIARQSHRQLNTGFSGQADFDWLRALAQLFALGLAVLVAFVPRRRGFAQIAALAAAVLIAVQLTADHWTYFYILWFFPALIAALIVGRDEDLFDRGR